MANPIGGICWLASRNMTRRGALIELAAWGNFVRVCLSLYLSVSYWQHRRQNARLTRQLHQLARQKGARVTFLNI